MNQELIKKKEERCLNCGVTLQGEYCHHCGQKNKDIQLSFFKLLKNFFDELTFFDNKIFNTLQLLCYHPSKLTQLYIEGKRARFVPPFRLYLFLSSIYFIFAISHLKEGMTQMSVNQNPELVEVVQDSILQKNLTIQLKKKEAFEEAKEDWINQKLKGLTAQYNENPKQLTNEFITTFSEKLPYLLYLSLPALAFFLWLFYWRNTKNYYVHHFIFSLYLFSTVFFYLILENLMELLINQFANTPFSFDSINFMLFGIFPFLALYSFYKQRLLKTFFKFIILSLLLSTYMFVLLLIMFIASIISL